MAASARNKITYATQPAMAFCPYGLLSKPNKSSVTPVFFGSLPLLETCGTMSGGRSERGTNPKGTLKRPNTDQHVIRSGTAHMSCGRSPPRIFSLGLWVGQKERQVGLWVGVLGPWVGLQCPCLWVQVTHSWLVDGSS